MRMHLRVEKNRGCLEVLGMNVKIYGFSVDLERVMVLHKGGYEDAFQISEKQRVFSGCGEKCEKYMD